MHTDNLHRQLAQRQIHVIGGGGGGRPAVYVAVIASFAILSFPPALNLRHRRFHDLRSLISSGCVLKFARDGAWREAEAEEGFGGGGFRRHNWRGSQTSMVGCRASAASPPSFRNFSLIAICSFSLSVLQILAPRNGYLPLLETDIRKHFARVIPPDSDSIWFDYQGLPLKWHIPTGVLYDLLVAEFERPWNLTVHFRAYPTEALTLCEVEAVKWNFVNALKEASYIMYGSTKSIMNMSQLDQVELWRCVSKGEMEGYDRIAARLRPGFGGGGNWVRDFLLTPTSDDGSSSPLLRAGSDTGRPSRVPIRVYVRTVDCDLDDLFDAAPVLSWDEVVYTTRPIDLRGGNILTVRDALLKMVPHLFSPPESIEKQSRESSPLQRQKNESETEGARDDVVVHATSDAAEEMKSTSSPIETLSGLNNPVSESEDLDFEGIIRIQGIEPSLDLPLEWVARNLCGPENFIHFIVISRRVAPQLPCRAVE